jgi:DNA-binding response OmpR family regulator
MAGGQRMLKVLIVEDDLMLADFAEEILVEHGYEISRIARPLPRRSGSQGVPS